MKWCNTNYRKYQAFEQAMERLHLRKTFIVVKLGH